MTIRPKPGSKWRNKVGGWIATVTQRFTHGGLDLVAFKAPKKIMGDAREIAINRALFLSDFVNCARPPQKQIPLKDTTMEATAPLEFHELANLFPLFDGLDLDELADDIERNGMVEPITLYDGKILDGRNRWRACTERGIQPVFTTYEGDDPLGHVVSLNLRRRHLNAAQRSMIAAKITTLGHGGDRKGVQVANSQLEKITLGKAADMMNVSKRSVSVANSILNRGVQALAEAVERGEVSLNSADTVSQLPASEQRAVAKKGGGEIKKKAAQTRTRALAGDSEWLTPINIIESARKVMDGIDLDPCSTHDAQNQVEALKYYTKAEDGLNQGPWEGTVLLHPPGQIHLLRDFVNQICNCYNDKLVSAAVVIVESATDTGWFHQLMEFATAMCLPLGRLAFQYPGKAEDVRPTHAHVIFYFGSDPTAFVLEFDKHGIVWSR